MKRASFVKTSRSVPSRRWFSAVVGLSVLFVLVAARPVSAQPLRHVRIGLDEHGRWVERPASPSEGPQQAVENYDNWRQPGSGGNTVFFDDLRVGDHEVGDDMQLVNYSGGVLDSLGFSEVNLSTTNTWDDYHLALRFYDRSSLTLLSAIEFNVDAIPSPPGARSLVFFDEGALERYGLRIAADMYMTIQFTNVQGIDPQDVGQVVGGPINTGSSSRFVRDFTAGQLVDLGDTRQANLGLFVKSIVPAPSVLSGLSVIVLAGAIRRSRRF